MKGSELKVLVKNSGLKNAEIIDKSGIPERTLYNLYEREDIEEHFLKKLAFLLPKTANDIKAVPYYDVDATAGNVTIFSSDGEEYIKQYITIPAFSDCDMIINVWGNSMYPKYCSGELIALKKIEDYEIVPLGEAYLVVTKEQRMLKYIRKSTQKGYWRLCSENVGSEDEKFPDFEVPIKKVLHLYIVKGKITKNII